MMNKGELHQLHKIAIERRPEVCMGCGHEHSCSVHGCAVINDAATELADKDAEIASLKSENERIRQNSVSQEAYQMMCEERGAPVVHGRWIKAVAYDFAGSLEGYKCNICGRFCTDNTEPYCHCGAEMDGKDDAK